MQGIGIMSFNFIDQITQFENKKFAVGSKTISQDYLPYCIHDELAPMLLIEAIGQLNAWITMEMNQFQVRPVAILFGEINLFEPAFIGDQLTVETELTRFDEQSSLFNGRVKKGKTILAEVIDAAGSFLDIHQFAFPEEYKVIFELLKSKRCVHHYDPRIKNSALFSYDAVENHTDTQITVIKTIPTDASFFREHFPKKAVLPISILLQNTLELGKEFIKKQLAESPVIKKIQLSRIKMRDFILPGDVLHIQLKLINADHKTVTFGFDNQVDKRSLCRGTLHFDWKP